MGNKIVLKSGDVFGQLTVIEESGRNHNGHVLYLCKCSCGKMLKVIGSFLLNENTKSCGCFRKQVVSAMFKTHGESSNNMTKEYRAWRHMINRCTNPEDNRYYRYGGRGIKVCDRWLESYENFLLDVGRAPSTRHSIDRINNDLNYEPSNFRWSTKIPQANNKSSNRIIEYLGEKLTLSQWARRCNIEYHKMWHLIVKKKINIKDIISSSSTNFISHSFGFINA